MQVTGRKQGAEEAKKRILAQVEKMVNDSLCNSSFSDIWFRPMKLQKRSRSLVNTIPPSSGSKGSTFSAFKTSTESRSTSPRKAPVLLRKRYKFVVGGKA